MENALNFLTEDDVRQITLLIEALEHSSFDFLSLEVGEIKLTLGRGGAPPEITAPLARVPISPETARAPARSEAVVPAAATAEAQQLKTPKDRQQDELTVAIVSPMLGRFYAKRDPGAPPFVSLGAMVDEDDTTALIEVMKVFNAVRAGVSGIITEICVEDGQLVEFGQVLFRVQPRTKEEASSEVQGSPQGTSR